MINSLWADNLAPETFENGTFSKASDVWGMGILIWDMYDLLSASSPTHIGFPGRLMKIISFRNGLVR